MTLIESNTKTESTSLADKPSVKSTLHTDLPPYVPSAGVQNTNSHANDDSVHQHESNDTSAQIEDVHKPEANGKVYPSKYYTQKRSEVNQLAKGKLGDTSTMLGHVHRRGYGYGYGSTHIAFDTNGQPIHYYQPHMVTQGNLGVVPYAFYPVFPSRASRGMRQFPQTRAVYHHSYMKTPAQIVSGPHSNISTSQEETLKNSESEEKLQTENDEMTNTSSVNTTQMEYARQQPSPHLGEVDQMMESTHAPFLGYVHYHPYSTYYNEHHPDRKIDHYRNVNQTSLSSHNATNENRDYATSTAVLTSSGISPTSTIMPSSDDESFDSFHNGEEYTGKRDIRYQLNSQKKHVVMTRTESDLTGLNISKVRAAGTDSFVNPIQLAAKNDDLRDPIIPQPQNYSSDQQVYSGQVVIARRPPAPTIPFEVSKILASALLGETNEQSCEPPQFTTARLQEFKSQLELHGLNLIDLVKTQSGSRLLQHLLSSQPSQEFLEYLFEEMLESLPSLVTNLFANYCVQLMIPLASSLQRQRMIERLYSSIADVIMDRQGTRVVQKLLHHMCKLEEQTIVLAALTQADVPKFKEIPYIRKLMDIQNTDAGEETKDKTIERVITKDVLERCAQTLSSCNALNKSDETVDHELELISDVVSNRSHQLLSLMMDQSASHVLLAVVDSFPVHLLCTSGILHVAYNAIPQLALDRFGVVLLKRILSVCSTNIFYEFALRTFSKDLVRRVVEDQYGNYLVQHILARARKTPENLGGFLSTAQASAAVASASDLSSNARMTDSTPQMNSFVEITRTRSVELTQKPSKYDRGLESEHLYDDILDEGTLAKYERILRALVDALTGDFVNFSKHRYSSNVVETCFRAKVPWLQKDLALELLREPNALAELLRDPFGSYIIQHALNAVRETDDEAILTQLLERIVKYHSSLKSSARRRWDEILSTFPSIFTEPPPQEQSQSQSEEHLQVDQQTLNVQSMHETEYLYQVRTENVHSAHEDASESTSVQPNDLNFVSSTPLDEGKLKTSSCGEGLSLNTKSKKVEVKDSHTITDLENSNSVPSNIQNQINNGEKMEVKPKAGTKPQPRKSLEAKGKQIQSEGQRTHKKGQESNLRPPLETRMLQKTDLSEHSKKFNSKTHNSSMMSARSATLQQGEKKEKKRNDSFKKQKAIVATEAERDEQTVQKESSKDSEKQNYRDVLLRGFHKDSSSKPNTAACPSTDSALDDCKSVAESRATHCQTEEKQIKHEPAKVSFAAVVLGSVRPSKQPQPINEKKKELEKTTFTPKEADNESASEKNNGKTYQSWADDDDEDTIVKKAPQ